MQSVNHFALAIQALASSTEPQQGQARATSPGSQAKHPLTIPPFHRRQAMMTNPNQTILHSISAIPQPGTPSRSTRRRPHQAKALSQSDWWRQAMWVGAEARRGAGRRELDATWVGTEAQHDVGGGWGLKRSELAKRHAERQELGTVRGRLTGETTTAVREGGPTQRRWRADPRS